MKVLIRLVLLGVFVAGCSKASNGKADSFADTVEFKNHICDFLPDNDIKIPINAKTLLNMNEQVFNEVLNEVSAIYSPIIAATGANLVVNRLWNNNEFNAKAYRQGRNYVIEMYGGLARHPDVTRDGFTLVACHEVGHHLGGAPKYNGTDWASNEGQSDYFASMKCARKVFRRYRRTPTNVDPEAEAQCSAHHDSLEKEICLRSAMGGLALAKAMSREMGGREPNLSHQDNNVVRKTQDSHPQPQCRLDTYFQGGLCEVSDNDNFNNSNPDVGACLHRQEESYGARPLCWFKPSNNPNPTPTPTPPPAGDVAAQPLINGESEHSSSNPRKAVKISWDVSEFRGARGVFIEFSRPNQSFRNPNGTSRDPNSLGGGTVAQVRGQISIVPQNQLPSWGRYEIRVIPLDRTGRIPQGLFSNSSILNMQP